MKKDRSLRHRIAGGFLYLGLTAVCGIWMRGFCICVMPENPFLQEGRMALGLVREAASAEIRRMPYRLRDGKRIVYEDSFLAERTYGGQRKHYGTDLMDLDNTPGEIPIYSMTYGRVSRMGWNEKGGWRVGVTSAAGIYYYYAHLAAFAENLGVGDFVEPGSLLGYMGDSGYGPEGTTGQFATHLHLGIQAYPEAGDVGWINPYPFLRGKKS